MGDYTRKAKKLIKSTEASIGDEVKVKKEGKTFKGLLMPQTGKEKDKHIILKLENGYNTGIKITEDLEFEKINEGREPEIDRKNDNIEPDENNPNISILGTGGTVASRVDYKTGAVKPTFSASEIYSAAPEIANIADIKAKTICNVLSENMSPELWEEIAQEVANELNSGADGVVIAHGTDTMGYTASALSFILKNLSNPVILVGSQRSSDRPSSDAPLNLASAVSVATTNFPKVGVVMHGSTEDDFCLVHKGSKVRKCHTSRRDAFQTINEKPIGVVKDQNVEFFQDVEKETSEKEVEVEGGFEEKVAMVKIHPGIEPTQISHLIEEDYKGIILEGTGLGHVPEALNSEIDRAIENGISVGMSSQCIWGRTNMKVYSTGRNLLDLGVYSLEDMLPETAYVKLMWVLNKTQDKEKVEELMKTNIAGEISSRTLPEDFLKPDLPFEDR